MPRFHWHVEGTGAFVPPGSLVARGDGGIVDAGVEVEVAGEGRTLRALLTMPANSTAEGAVRDVGVALAQGEGPAFGAHGALATALAVALAKAGYVVLREVGPCDCEVRRQRAFEKALDAAATSPYARGVRRWVLAGLGGGARVAAVVGARARSPVAGQCLLGYPLAAPMPTIKGSQMPDSCMPLLRLMAPALLIVPGADPACPLLALRSALRVAGSPDVRLVVAEGVGAEFQAPGAAAPGPAPELLASLVAPALQFIGAVTAGALASCALPRAKGPEDGPPTAAGIAALQAAHIRMQEEDGLALQAPPASLLPPLEATSSGQQQPAAAAAPPPAAAAAADSAGSGGGGAAAAAGGSGGAAAAADGQQPAQAGEAEQRQEGEEAAAA